MQYYAESSSGMGNNCWPESPQTNPNQSKPLPSKAFIINHKTFSNHKEKLKLRDREESVLDVENLEKVFCSFKLETKVLQDPLKNDVKRLMKKIAKTDFSKFAAILIVIMSHGGPNGLIFTNDPSENPSRTTNCYFLHADIRHPILTNPSLRDKHKLIFVQACRGSFDPMFAESSGTMAQTEPADFFLTLCSSYEGSISYIYKDGSPFINALCNNLRNFGATKCISVIATDIIKDVKNTTICKQTPTLETNFFNEHKFIIGEFAKHKGKGRANTARAAVTQRTSDEGTCFATIAVLACVALVRCEPPVPQNSYLPPNQQSAEPSNNYLPPTQSYQSPANNYLPPQRSQSPSAAPQSTYAAPSSAAPAPAITSAIFPKQQQSNGNYPASQGYSNSGYGNGNGNGNGAQAYSGYGEENYGPAKYEFKYDVQDYESGNDFGHMEARDGDRTVGRYYVLLPDGRKQVVDYEADQNGYRPTISYEQTGNVYNGGAQNGNGGAAGRDGAFSGYDANAQSKYQGYN